MKVDSNMRWWSEDALPDDVRAEMRDMLAESLREAARISDPGDGRMLMLSGDKSIGKGMWDGGWKIQASFVQDARMNPKPYVVVHAYQDSQCSKGSVLADVNRTAADRHFVYREQLKAMVTRRDQLNVDIERLMRQLELESL